MGAIGGSGSGGANAPFMGVCNDMYGPGTGKPAGANSGGGGPRCSRGGGAWRDIGTDMGDEEEEEDGARDAGRVYALGELRKREVGQSVDNAHCVHGAAGILRKRRKARHTPLDFRRP